MEKNIKIIIICICTFLLTGCGKDKVDYVTETSTPTDGIATSISTGSLEEQIGAEEVWEEDIDVAKVKKICAEVVIPDTSGMKVVNLERVSFDAEFKRDFMENLTDGPVYNYDYQYQTKADIEENIQYYKDIIADLEAQGYDPYNEESEYYHWYQALKAEEELLEQAPEDYVLAEDYSCYTYLFEDNGIEYIVNFIGDGSTMDRWIVLDVKNPEEIVDESKYTGVFFGSTGDYMSIIEEDENTNRCDIKEEEAETLALDFVSQLDLGDFKVVDTEMLSVYCTLEDGRDETFLYGYTFKLYRAIDDIEVDGNDYIESAITYEQYSESLTENYNANSCNFCFEEITVSVTDQGVVRMQYISPYKYKETVAENVNLQSFDSVKSVAIEEISAKSYYEYDTMRRMELGYYNYWDEDTENTVIIPVWKLTTDTSGNCTPSDSFVLINAMDGTVINVGKQHYTSYNLRDADNVDESTDN